MSNAPAGFRARDVCRNFRYYSSLSFMLIRQPSGSAEEARAKARPFQAANRAIGLGTAAFGGGSLAGVMRYCLTADRPVRKVALVALYVIFLRDILYVGSNAGLLLALPSALNALLRAPPDTRVRQAADRVQQLAREGRPLPDLDRVFRYLNDIADGAEPAHPGFVQNNFFARNPQLVAAEPAAPAFFFRYAEASPAWEQLLGPADCLVARRVARKVAALAHVFS